MPQSRWLLDITGSPPKKDGGDKEEDDDGEGWWPTGPTDLTWEPPSPYNSIVMDITGGDP